MSVTNISNNYYPVLNKSEEEMEQEFKKLPDSEFSKASQCEEDPQQRFSDGVQLWNQHKNRYQNIIPYNATRVKLIRDEKDPNRNDYINASYCLQKTAIISQGPQGPHIDFDAHTDFYHMLWTNGSTAVAMLTSYNENDAPKCDFYLPFSGCRKTTGEYSIFGTEDNSDEAIARLNKLGIRVTHLSIKKENKEGKIEERKVKHYHYSKWADHKGGNAKIVAALAEQMLKETMPVIHCSAGIGRSGTLAAVMSAWKKIMNKEVFNVFDVVSFLRSFERHGAVQTLDQYKTVYAALKILLGLPDEALEQSTSSFVPLEDVVKPGKVIADEPKATMESNNNTILPQIQVTAQPTVNVDKEKKATIFQQMLSTDDLANIRKLGNKLPEKEADEFYLQLGLLKSENKGRDDAHYYRFGMQVFYCSQATLEECKAALESTKEVLKQKGHSA